MQDRYQNLSPRNDTRSDTACVKTWKLLAAKISKFTVFYFSHDLYQPVGISVTEYAQQNLAWSETLQAWIKSFSETI